MLKPLFITALAALVFGTACVQKPADIPFTVAQNYFIKNTVNTTTPLTLKITSQAAFDSVFGMATVMGPNGHPTPVDFTRQFVLAITGKATNTTTRLSPISLKKVANHLEFTYHVSSGQPASFTMVPSLVILADNKYSSDDVLYIEDKKP
jgi:hypothetical protein